MRSVNADDHWRRIYSRDYKLYLDSIQLNGLIGFQNIDLGKGLYVICGLNGAGKSTILSAIKSVLGMPLTLPEHRKIIGNVITASIQKNGNCLNCQNSVGQRAIELGLASEEISYVDYYTVTKTLGYFFRNVDEAALLDGTQPVPFENVELSDLSCIVGRQYDACTFYELDDIVFEDEPMLMPMTIPFFEVSSSGVNYNSLEMGIGEHFIFYVFWLLKRAGKDSIVIIEEPETFISIKAQVELMNYIAFCCYRTGISVVITTHSPYILERIDNDHIRVINRVGRNVSVSIPTDEYPATRLLGLSNYLNKGVIYVEDEAAKVFLFTLLMLEAPLILDTFKIIAVKGESEITRRLKFPNDSGLDYELIGIYDADMQINKVALEKTNNWPFLFLPVRACVEIEIIDAFKNQDFLECFIQKIDKKKEIVLLVLAKIDGEDPHDWLIDLCHDIQSDFSTVMRAFYSLWRLEPTVQTNVSFFLNEFERVIYPPLP